MTLGQVLAPTRGGSSGRGRNLLICCGMSAWFSFVDVPGAGLSDERTAGQRCGLTESDIWHFARFACQWEIFSERIIRISFPHQDLQNTFSLTRAVLVRSRTGQTQ